MYIIRSQYCSMMGQNLPDDAQEKMEELQELQEQFQQMNEQLQQVEGQLESAQNAQSFLNEVEDDDATVFRQVDELIVEVDYDNANSQISEKVGELENAVDALETRRDSLQSEFESLQEELEEIMEGSGMGVGE